MGQRLSSTVWAAPVSERAGVDRLLLIVGAIPATAAQSHMALTTSLDQLGSPGGRNNARTQ